MLWLRSDLFPFAGVVIEAISSAAGTLVVASGLSAGSLRAWAVLTDAAPDRVEWATAAGFAAGIVFGAALIALDVVLS